ncbi:hypothetical protein ACS45_05335 [Bacillus cereus]|nr:hypothetical protein ACS45_05335 [Bacillus cereus]
MVYERRIPTLKKELRRRSMRIVQRYIAKKSVISSQRIHNWMQVNIRRRQPYKKKLSIRIKKCMKNRSVSTWNDIESVYFRDKWLKNCWE